MSVRIQLDKAHTGSHFTNLDIISGVAILSIVNTETVTSITVKLEGESRSRLAPPTHLQGRSSYDPYERDQAQLEVHKVSECLLLSKQSIY